MEKYVGKIPFTHTAFGPFVNAVKHYINDFVYPFNYTVIGTLDKSIQMIHQRKSDPEIQRKGLFSPILSLTTVISEMVPETDNIMRYINGHPFAAPYFYNPFIWKDDNELYIVTKRVYGRIDFKVFADSYMEAQDIYMNLTDGFRGINKWIYLQDIKTAVLLSDEVLTYTVDGTNPVFNWGDTIRDTGMIRSIDHEKYYLPLKSKPCIRMESLADSSAFFGGQGLPEFTLSGSFGFEMELPSFYVLETDTQIKGIVVNIKPTTLKDPGLTGPGIIVVDDPESGEPAVVRIIDEIVVENPGEYPIVIPKDPDKNKLWGIIIIYIDGFQNNDVVFTETELEIIITSGPVITADTIIMVTIVESTICGQKALKKL
jgi:hypothetical protein